MDYKTNILHHKLETDQQLLPEIQALNFGIINNNQALFDYTDYIEKNQLNPTPYKAFMRQCKPFIEALSAMSGRKTSEMFYQNTDGHILISAELVFICIAFIDSGMCAYFNGLLTNVITDGIAFSHGYIYDLASENLPSQILDEIIKERNGESETSNE